MTSMWSSLHDVWRRSLRAGGTLQGTFTMFSFSTRRTALAALVAASFTASAWGQSVGTPMTAGTNPIGVALNPITNKLYVANAGTQAINGTDSTISVLNASNGTVLANLPGSAYTQWVAVNIETGNAFASGLLGGHTKVIGPNNTEVADLATSNAGWTAVDTWSGMVYVIRYGDSDEFNWLQDGPAPTYEIASATRSLKPTSLAYNPVTQTLYMVHELTGDVVAMDTSSRDSNGKPPAYPTLKCPSTTPGQYAAQPTAVPLPVQPGYVDPWNNNTNPPSSYKMHPCIDVPDTPKWVTVNPKTNIAYAISDGSTNQISVIDGNNFNHFTSLSVAGHSGGKVIAVNPVTGKVYALFSDAIVEINVPGGNLQAVLPVAGSPVAIGINTFTNRIYVPTDSGSLYVINGADGSLVTTLTIPANAQGITVNPLTNTVYITDKGGQVTPVFGGAGETAGSTGVTTAITALPGNSSSASGTITLNASSTFGPAPLNTVRKAFYRIDGGAWVEGAVNGSGGFTAAYSGLAAGSHTIEAFATIGLEAANLNTDLASAPVLGNVASYTFSVANTAVPSVSLSRTSIDFGGQSMNTTSPAETVTVTNSGSGTLSISGVAITGSGSGQFAQANDCTSVAPSATCTISVTFTPAIIAGAALNSATPVSATLTISSNAASSPDAVSLAGNAEKSLVSHFYRSILRRAPDDGGKAFWQDQLQQTVNLGMNVNEAWFGMAMSFYAGAEYAAFNRDDAGFVTDLYKTFFNREPDSDGLAFWKDQIAQGLPRSAVLDSFMFSQEFRNFTQAIFGNTAVRAEIDVVGDFYRGMLGRMPDPSGFNYWVGQFRQAQCQGAAAVQAQAEQISATFVSGPEYSAKNRANVPFIEDMYNAFLRRGGDAGGIKGYNDLLVQGKITRDQTRQSFRQSAEFSAHVQAIVNQGCMQ
jgi:DNA-binding beta-propeller fold protein YncE